MPQIFNGSLVDGLLDALAERLLAAPELIDEYTVADVRWYLESLVADAGVTDVGSDRDECDESMNPDRIEATGSEEALQQCDDDTLEALLGCNLHWCAGEDDRWTVRQATTVPTRGCVADEVRKAAKLAPSKERCRQGW